MSSRLGKRTVAFMKNISIRSAYSVVGPMEANGPLHSFFDELLEDDTLKEKSYEKAESAMLRKVYDGLIKKCGIRQDEIDMFIGGDLLNQIIATTYAVRGYESAYYGVYNACSTFSLAIQIASNYIESSSFNNIIVSASSHFSSAERQYRTPLELGCKNPPTAQRTVTGAGGLLLSSEASKVRIKNMTAGKVVDFGIKDPFDMSSAMAPAATDTILTHFNATKTNFQDYDLVLTGDLSEKGVSIVSDMLKDLGFPSTNLTDCGKLIYNRQKQNVGGGGSGAGCSTVVFCGYIYDLMLKEKLKKVLFVPTGALLSPTSTLQKESIPAIAHAVCFEV